MALTRSELKTLIKGLLIEVLTEGLGDMSGVVPRPSATTQGRAQVTEARRRKPAFDARLDTPVRSGQSDDLTTAIRRNAGGNPIMEGIFADTASRTLPTLMANDPQLGQSSMPDEGAAPARRGIAQVEQINGTPEDIFGEETAGRWADLAFATDKKPL